MRWNGLRGEWMSCKGLRGVKGGIDEMESPG